MLYHQSGIRKNIRNGTKVEKTIEMDYGEIKASTQRGPKVYKQCLFMQRITVTYRNIQVNVQRLSPYGRVKPQAYGGRKI